ncbi:MAG: hypothetical protein HY720_13035 [Planctomycetes bacterium]|nr:hypothetical protein [Planctomycetota bacterium]
MTKRSEEDLLFGQIAVSTRLVTEEHIKHCLELQAKESPPKPLGQILVEQDYLTIGQLDHLIKTQAERLLQIDRKSKTDPREALFGRLAVQSNFISQEQLNESLREQANIARLKIYFRLGEILIKKRYMTPDQVRRTLEGQQKKILQCPRCGSRYNISSFEEGSQLACKKCAGRLVLPPKDESVVVKETLRMDARRFKAMKDLLSGRAPGEPEEELDA